MARLISLPSTTMIPPKHLRRNATAVMAGAFDPRPSRDVLTSLLNGVEPYKVVEKDEEERRIRRRERKEREKERRKAKAAARARASTPAASTSSAPVVQSHRKGPSSFWAARPSIHIATMQRSVSISPPPPEMSPPPLPYTPSSTPGPSISSSTSRTSSKRPHTPNDFEFDDYDIKPQMLERKRRLPPAKKGWKGWVEGSPPPSEKLINLDAVPVLRERRTRSGKNFDAIGVGKEGWV
ncbi:hypothetical protein C8J56DRAFT_1010865 [Mycena floridula]|nr:hypothetical protein C8J56DRAFT_1010865 [Mycena floridula]